MEPRRVMFWRKIRLRASKLNSIWLHNRVLCVFSYGLWVCDEQLLAHWASFCHSIYMGHRWTSDTHTHTHTKFRESKTASVDKASAKKHMMGHRSVGSFALTTLFLILLGFGWCNARCIMWVCGDYMSRRAKKRNTKKITWRTSAVDGQCFLPVLLLLEYKMKNNKIWGKKRRNCLTFLDETSSVCMDDDDCESGYCRRL